MAPFLRIQCRAALVSRPPENAMPTFWPTGRFSRMVLMGKSPRCAPPRSPSGRSRGARLLSTEVADVVVGLRHPDLEAGLAGDGELLARCRLLPFAAAGQLVFAGA